MREKDIEPREKKTYIICELLKIFILLPRSVIGNTPDSGSGKSRFDP